MQELRYIIAKVICRILPPIISQKVRDLLIKLSEGSAIKRDFVTRSFTGSKFYGNTSDFHAFKFSIHGFYDWRNVIISEQVLKTIAGGIIEVGANIGTETISFADVASRFDQKVVAFEPLPSNFEFLQNNIKKNNLLNAEIEASLVSDSVGIRSFQGPDRDSSGSGHITSEDSPDTVEFKVTTLDVFCKNFSVALIALDVEGFEYHVLLGAQNIIKTQRPVVIAEVNQFYLRNRANMSVAEFHQFFTENNYVCFYVMKLGLQKVEINDFKVMPNKNWVCIPVEHFKIAKMISKSLLFNGINPFFNFIHFK